VTDDDRTVLAEEIDEEQRYLDRVHARLDAAEERARSLVDEAIARGTLGTDAGVREDDMRALFESGAFIEHALRRTHVLDAEREGVVFGRLDLRDGEVRHVGRIGVRDEEYERLVVDWRAPAAEPYYRATPLDPQGVVRRRTITSSGGHVVGVDDDLLDPDHVPDGMRFVGDGALLSAMSRTRDDRMHSIVATIQADQDAAIRAPSRGTVLISGGPGTGKTVVALHRVAYLLYSDRRRFETGGVLVVGPSLTFVHYVDRVLPSLGEESVVLSSLGDLVPHVAATARDTGDVAALKGSAERALPLLRRAIERLAPMPGDPLRLTVAGTRMELARERVAAVRDEAFATRLSYDDAVAATARGLVDALWEQWRRDPPRWVTRAAFVDEVRHARPFRSYVRRACPKPDPREVFDVLRRQQGWRGPLTVDDVALLDELVAMTGTPYKLPADPDDVVPDFGEEEPEGEAPAPVPEPRTEFAHVVVDEAQELTPMQWRMLARRGPRASWTVVADVAQSALADRDAARAAMEAVLPAPRHAFRLSTNYRNPREIFAVAVAALNDPSADIPVAARSTGRDPESRVVDDLTAGVATAVEDLLALVAGSVAVIASDVAPYAGLADGRVRVMTPYECKGLEFDGVVVVSPERIAAEPGVGPRALYVVLTRATQHLIGVTSGAA
jgi:DNA helicase IV